MTDTAPVEPLSIPGLAEHGIAGLARTLEAQQLASSAGACDRPIRLVGGREVIEAGTGLLLDSTSGQHIHVPCGNRRASRCAYCSTLYRFDAYNLIAAGLRGGKQTPDTVGGHPRLFVTLTAPSFGPVHLGPDKAGNRRVCNPRRDGTGCGRWHAPGDPAIGKPLDPAGYDYTGQVLFNALAAGLWTATTGEIRRAFAAVLGIPRRKLRDHLKLEFAKVAEYQARGVVHFHAVIRIDGPDGPSSAPPAWATLEQLETAIHTAVSSTRLEVPETRELGARDIIWGQQIDVRPIAAGELDGQLSDTVVARYIAKYATKGAEAVGVELPSLACRACSASGRLEIEGRSLPCRACDATGRTLDLDAWGLSEHHRILIETCWRLGAIPELAPLGLRRWAHMLGFGGHFATKSRTYSTTFGALRQERADFMASTDPTTTGLADNTDVIVINHWSFAGHGDGPSSATLRRPHVLREGEAWTDF